MPPMGADRLTQAAAERLRQAANRAENNGSNNGDNNGNNNNGDGPMPSWKTSEAPKFSRAFAFTFDSPTRLYFNEYLNEFAFTPTYLKASQHVKRLHQMDELKARLRLQATRDLARPLDNSSRGPSGPAGVFAPAPLPPGSHRGISHAIVERLQVYDDIEWPARLPNRWNKNDMSMNLELTAHGFGLRFAGPKHCHERENEASAVRSDHAAPRDCGLYYYEAVILSGIRDETTICVGFSTNQAALTRPIGWEPDSWGYHGDDGRIFCGRNDGKSYGPTFNPGDVIGCGINFRDNTMFFTRNGNSLGTAFKDLPRTKLYPAVSLRKPDEAVHVNFGQEAFVYDIDGYMKEQQAQVRSLVDNAPVSKLGLEPHALLQVVVAQFLHQEGYPETADTFIEEAVARNNATRPDAANRMIKEGRGDGESATVRQRIRRSVLDGDIDTAMRLTSAVFPRALKENEKVHFKLKCRKFVEMVRKAGELRMVQELREKKAANGDIPTTTADAEIIQLEQSALEYGQALQAEYANDTREVVIQTLSDIWGLLAFGNPLKEPSVVHLVDGTGRFTISEELNAAILRSQGKSPRTAVERMWAQTSLLLEGLRPEGGDAAYISMDTVLESLKKVPMR